MFIHIVYTYILRMLLIFNVEHYFLGFGDCNYKRWEKNELLVFY